MFCRAVVLNARIYNARGACPRVEKFRVPMMSPDERFTDMPCRKSRDRAQGRNLHYRRIDKKIFPYIHARVPDSGSHDSIWVSLEDSDEMPLIFTAQPVYSK